MRMSAEPVARTSASRNADSSAELRMTFETGAFTDQSRTADVTSVNPRSGRAAGAGSGGRGW